MNKGKFRLLIMLLVMTFLLVGCMMQQGGNESTLEYEDRKMREGFSQSEHITLESKRLVPTGESLLYYDSETLIVYYYFTDIDAIGGGQSRGYGFLSPFYSENGKIMKFDVETRKLIELN